MGRSAVDSNELFIDALLVPVADRIGEEGKGFEYILHGMNPERILIGAEGIGLGRAALRRRRAYAKERIVFDRPIGQNQAIQHPLAACWMALEAANLMAFKAASLYDAGLPCGVEANAAKYLAGEACFKACETALMTHGGMGYAKEFHVERYLRESLIVRIAPITPHLILSFHRREGAGPAQILLTGQVLLAELKNYCVTDAAMNCVLARSAKWPPRAPSSSNVPDSVMRPASNTRMRLALRIVASRCAITKVVRPFITSARAG
jgi:hypothetical protein